ncbi:stage II sporulation protein M [Paenalkalicoccus suaedae]|uniref:Stage II sporulation protein M n=2 Tax=Paenalkalicoccus suaedae TaxID=2592382 RepID=A0A859FK36_9BACI|nr:stage II sporulation protein M [Paenalkalicoccus suaedae]
MNFFIVSVTLIIVAMIVTLIIHPDISRVQEFLDSRSSDQVSEADGLTKVWAYIVNNGFMVPLQMFVIALIPIQFLYFINVVSTSIITGFVYGVVLQLDIKQGSEVILSAVPYTFFEIIAYCIFAAVLFKLNQAVRSRLKRIFKKDHTREESNTIIKRLLGTFLTYGVFVLPLIIVAAFMETYVADMILNLF